jgi:hypothetical protein
VKSTKKAKKAPKTAAQKEEDENYPTPMPLCLAITAKVKELVTGTDVERFNILEPSAGAGHFVRAINATWPGSPIIAVDPRPKHQGLCEAAGATLFYPGMFESFVAKESKSFNDGKVLLAVGNPPFSLAQKHLELMFKTFPPGSYINFLLRFGFMGGKERNLSFWDFQGLPYLRYLVPITPRPSFVKGRNDNSEYGLFIWKVGNTEPAEIKPAIVWEK